VPTSRGEGEGLNVTRRPGGSLFSPVSKRSEGGTIAQAGQDHADGWANEAAVIATGRQRSRIQSAFRCGWDETCYRIASVVLPYNRNVTRGQDRPGHRNQPFFIAMHE